MADFGYDISDYRAVDPIFGTLADFDRLVARAHELGLKVVIDQVYAHTSDAHVWFQESRADRAEPASRTGMSGPTPGLDGTPPNNWLSVFYGPSWTWDGRRGQYYMHNFLPTQPNLNVNNPAVQEALFDTARFWLERGVDGFRLDAINFAMHDPAADRQSAGAGSGRSASARSISSITCTINPGPSFCPSSKNWPRPCAVSARIASPWQKSAGEQAYARDEAVLRRQRAPQYLLWFRFSLRRTSDAEP